MLTRNKFKKLLVFFSLLVIIGVIFFSSGFKFNADLVTNNIASFSVETYQNFETISVYANIVGDENSNSTASFKYKKSSESEWIDGMDMSPIYGSSKKAGFFFADEGTEYNVQITVADVDGAPSNNVAEATATARSLATAISNGNNLYVSANSGDDDTNDGSESQPFKTIGKAAGAATAGTTVNIMSGTYRERINFGGYRANERGVENNWITFKNYGNDQPLMDGSFPNALTWTEFDPVQYPGIYRTEVAYQSPFYLDSLSVGGQMAYQWTNNDTNNTDSDKNLKMLKENTLVDRFGNTVQPVAQVGWAKEYYTSAVDGDMISVYLKIREGEVPDSQGNEIELANPGVNGVAFAIDGTEYIKIKGLSFKNYKVGVRITTNTSTSDIIVEGNTFNNNLASVAMSGNTINPEETCNNISILNNTMTLSGHYGLNWSALKASAQETSGISFSNMNKGAHVFNNTISGYFNGIFMGGWPPHYGYGYDSDIYNNNISNGGDDGLEMEGTDMTNIRLWDNKVKNFMTTLSAVPVLSGPLYFFRNTGENVEMGVKLGSAHATDTDPLSNGYLYVYHNSFNSTQSGGTGTYCTNEPTYKNSTFLNNIFNTDGYLIVHGSGPPPYDGSKDCISENVRYDYNLMYSNRYSGNNEVVMWDRGQYISENRYSTIAEFYTATGQAEHSVILPPIYQDFDNGDFHLMSNSPGIDSGTTIPGFNDCSSPWPSSGSAPDVGAFETSGSDSCTAPISPPDPPSDTDTDTDPNPDPVPDPVLIDTAGYLNLPVSRFSNSWNMVSFPGTSGNVSNDELGLRLNDGFKIRRYNTASNSYTKGDITPIMITPGQGYWLKIEDSSRINGLKYPLAQSSPVEMGITKGWNLLGSPFQTDLPLSNLKIKYKDGSTRTYAEAIARKEVSGYAWSYESSEKRYYLIAINPNNYRTTSPKNTVIKPFRGFWIIAKTDRVSSVIMEK